LILRHFIDAPITEASKDCALHTWSKAPICWPGDEETWRKTMQTVMKFALALALAGGVALSVTALSLTGATAGPRDQQCIPQYDSSGAQVAPYC
jgi:hypothetical protein